jgi:hypothetical protein
MWAGTDITSRRAELLVNAADGVHTRKLLENDSFCDHLEDIEKPLCGATYSRACQRPLPTNKG